MITKLPESSGANIGFLIHGKLTDGDYRQTLIPVLEEAIKSEGRIRLLLKMDNFEGWTPLGAWDEFINWPKFQSIERIAIIVDENWHDLATWLFEVFAIIAHIEIKFFDKDRLLGGWAWIKK
ncbi:MAG: STAS/SEC14 domain-containing protein [Methanomicrobiaceae archaeon]|nr:STAS/SEC14 domain-containing protein [Methanomicrobiaceae archaeon]